MFRVEQREIAEFLKKKLEEEFGLETSFAFNKDNSELCGPVYFNFKKKEGGSNKIITITVDCQTIVNTGLKK